MLGIKTPNCDCNCNAAPIPCDAHGVVCLFPQLGVMHRCYSAPISGLATIQPPYSVRYLAIAIIPAVSDEDPERYCVVAEDRRIFVTEAHTPWEMWTLATTAASTPRDVAFATSSIGLVVGDNGMILRTKNGGATWSAVAIASTANFRSIVIRGRKVLICGGGEIWRSLDRGATWSPMAISGASDLLSIDLRDTIGWATGGGLFRSEDSGATWSAITAPAEAKTCVCFFSETAGVFLFTNDGAAGWLRIWKSTDRGVTWAQKFQYGPDFYGTPNISIRSALSFSADRIDAVGGSDDVSPVGLTRLYITSDDAGETWVWQPTGTPSHLPGASLYGIDRSARGNVLICGDSDDFNPASRFNDLCPAVGDSPTGWIVSRIDSTIEEEIYFPGGYALAFAQLISGPYFPPCVWNSADPSLAIWWRLDLSGSDAVLTLHVNAESVTYSKPMSDWEVGGANLMTYATGTLGPPTITRVWLCPNNVETCSACSAWSDYSVTIPALTGYTGGGAAIVQNVGGCTWEGTFEGQTVQLGFSRDVNGFFSASAAWGSFTWFNYPIPPGMSLECESGSIAPFGWPPSYGGVPGYASYARP